MRLCLDTRQANKIFFSDREASEHIDDILERFEVVKYISIDLVSGFRQISLEKTSRQ